MNEDIRFLISLNCTCEEMLNDYSTKDWLCNNYSYQKIEYFYGLDMNKIFKGNSIYNNYYLFLDNIGNSALDFQINFMMANLLCEESAYFYNFCKLCQLKCYSSVVLCNLLLFLVKVDYEVPYYPEYIQIFTERVGNISYLKTHSDLIDKIEGDIDMEEWFNNLEL